MGGIRIGRVDHRRRTSKKRAGGVTPFEQPDAIPTFLDPEFDNLEEAEADIRAAYRGRSDED